LCTSVIVQIVAAVSNFFVPNAEQYTFEDVASILVMISKVEAGRRILMERKRGLVK
jgi:hypothetical protein